MNFRDIKSIENYRVWIKECWSQRQETILDNELEGKISEWLQTNGYLEESVKLKNNYSTEKNDTENIYAILDALHFSFNEIQSLIPTNTTYCIYCGKSSIKEDTFCMYCGNELLSLL